jgi:superfamily II DNA or RNA helicase
MEHGGAELLDTPLDRAGSWLHGPARDLLVGLFEAGEIRTLRDVLRAPEDVEHQATARELEALSAQLESLLHPQTGPDDPARLPRVPAAPRDLEALLVWARTWNVLGELSAPAIEALGPKAPRDATLVQLALGADAGLAPLEALSMRDAALAHLSARAREESAASAREALWARPAREGTSLLASRLRSLVSGTSLTSLHSVRFAPARSVSLDPKTGVCRGLFVAHEQGAPRTVRLRLSGFEQRVPSGECESCARPGCIHVRALAGRLLDACHDEEDSLRGAIDELVLEPSWRRFLDAVTSSEAAEPSDSKIGFELELNGDRASVRVLRRDDAGARPISPARALDDASDVDRFALELMAARARAAAPSFTPCDITLLRALVDHPRVRARGDGASLRVLEDRPLVTLCEQHDGIRPVATLGPVELPVGDRPRDASALVVRDGDEVRFAPLTPPLRRLLVALGNFPGVLPPESYAQLAPWLRGLGGVATLTLPKVLRGIERAPLERLLLRVRPGVDESVEVGLALRALPMGAIWPPGGGPEIVDGIENGVHVFARRDLARERTRASVILEALALEKHVRIDAYTYRVEGLSACLEVLSRAARFYDELTVEWAELAQKKSIVGAARVSDLSVTLAKRGEWLALEGRVHVTTRNGAVVDVALNRLLEAARTGERFVEVQAGDFLELEHELAQRLEAAQLCVLTQGRAAVLPSAGLEGWLRALGDSTELAPSAQDVLDSVRASPDDERLDARWEALLRPYQRYGARWLLAKSRGCRGACLADEMGLGKTVQTLAVLASRRSMGPAIIVCPTSLVGNWTLELERFAPELTVRSWGGPLSEGVVLLTTFEQLVRRGHDLEGHEFATLVIDEAQMIKNARTQRARAVSRVPARFRIALTGTPIENRLGDLYSLMHALEPQLFGSWERFRGRYAVPIERYQDEQRAEHLRDLVSPFFLRRTKDQVARELPPRTDVVKRVELSPPERELYDAAHREARRALEKRVGPDDTRRVLRVLSELTRLRQLACHPRLVTDDSRLHSSKLDAFLGLTREILSRGSRALVFSQFTRHLELAREALEARGLTTLYLDGSTPGAARTDLVRRFQDGEGQLFLISLKAGGTGLNLTGADYVIHLDPWWNPAAEEQAGARAHRIGQMRPVTVVRLVAERTIEEKVLALHEHKRELANAVLGGELGGFTETELEDLLGDDPPSLEHV